MDKNFLEEVRQGKHWHDPIENYIFPGMTSWLVGDQSFGLGTLRLFQMNRFQISEVTPHTHRFNFKAWVLQGKVINRIWLSRNHPKSDSFMVSRLKYKGKPGEYIKTEENILNFLYIELKYESGDEYEIYTDEIHSIHFGKNSLVLIQESAVISNKSVIIEPYVNGQVIETLKTEDWMFKKPGC